MLELQLCCWVLLNRLESKHGLVAGRIVMFVFVRFVVRSREVFCCDDDSNDADVVG